MAEQVERRHIPEDVQVRQDGEEGVIEGHAALFDSETEIAGLFVEKIAPGAFAESVEEDDVRALFNHDVNQVLGRNTAGTLELEETDKGLRDQIELPDNTVGANVQESVERGDVTGQSFGFRVEEESWERTDDDELDVRTVEKARIVDVGPVTFPAYEDTDVKAAKRSWRENCERQEGDWHGISYDSAHEQVETAPDDAEWDANEAMTEADEDDYPMMCAAERGEGGDRADYKLPHHFTDGRAVKAAVDNAVARLEQTDLPDSAKSTARAHLERHQSEDFDEDEEESAGARRRRLVIARARVELNAV